MEMLIQILLIPVVGVQALQFAASWSTLFAALVFGVQLAAFGMDAYLGVERAVFGAKASNETTWADRFRTLIPFFRFYWELFRPAIRWLGRLALAALALLVIAVLVGNWYFFEPILRWQLSRAADKAGVTIEFASATGSLWTGRVEMNDARIARPEHPAMTFDIQVRELVIDVDYLDLWHRSRVQTCHVVGLKGEIERRQAEGKGLDLEALLQSGKRRRRIVVEDFSLTDATVKLSDSTRPKQRLSAELEINSFTLAPLKSDWLIFDVFFRAQLAGKINGRPVSIASRVIEGGRETKWKADGLPVPLVAPYLGGPITWIREGTVDLEVTDRWQTDGEGRPKEIHMHWTVVFRDVRAEAPKELGLWSKAVAVPVLALLNRKGKELKLEFEFEADPEGFYLASSEDLSEWWGAMGELLAKELAKEAGMTADEIKRTSGAVWDALQPLRRKKPVHHVP